VNKQLQSKKSFHQKAPAKN